MAIIKEIHETHVIIEENSFKHEVSVETIKFEPRINDYVSLIRDENGFITNVFLERKPEPEVIFIRQPQEQDIKMMHNQALNYALDRSARTISLFAIIVGFIFSASFFTLLIYILSPDIFYESLKQVGIDESIISGINFYVTLAPQAIISPALITLGYLTRYTKNRKRQRIFIISILVSFSIYIISALVISQLNIGSNISSVIGSIILSLIPVIHSIIYLKNHNRFLE